jgi:hypothetical protein
MAYVKGKMLKDHYPFKKRDVVKIIESFLTDEKKRKHIVKDNLGRFDKEYEVFDEEIKITTINGYRYG